MFPIPPLPNAALVFALAGCGYGFCFRHRFCKFGFHQPQSSRIMTVAFRQPHQSMQMIRQDAHRNNFKGMLALYFGKYLPQAANMPNQQILHPVLQHQRKKAAATLGKSTAIFHHALLFYLWCWVFNPTYPTASSKPSAAGNTASGLAHIGFPFSGSLKNCYSSASHSLMAKPINSSPTMPMPIAETRRCRRNVAAKRLPENTSRLK